MGGSHDHSHGHSHGDGLDDAFDPDLRRRLTLLVAVVALATLVGVALLWPGKVERRELGALGVPRAWYDATVTKVAAFPCPGEEGSNVTTTTIEGLAPRTDASRETLVVLSLSAPPSGMAMRPPTRTSRSSSAR